MKQAIKPCNTGVRNPEEKGYNSSIARLLRQELTAPDRELNKESCKKANCAKRHSNQERKTAEEKAQ